MSEITPVALSDEQLEKLCLELRRDPIHIWAERFDYQVTNEQIEALRAHIAYQAKEIERLKNSPPNLSHMLNKFR